MLFAMAKGSPIVTFLMHTKYEQKAFRVILVGGFARLSILSSVTLGNYITRRRLPFAGK